MSPRSASVNEEMRERSRQRLLDATYKLLREQGYQATTLADIARRAGVARGLISYYFPSKQHLFQATVHRIMYTTLADALARIPPDTSPDARLAWTIDSILGLAATEPSMFRAHLSLILQPEAAGFVEEPERQRLGVILQSVMAQCGAPDPLRAHALLRSALMGAVVGLILPGAETPLKLIRADLFARYRLSWDLGDPPCDVPPAHPGGIATKEPTTP